MRRLMLLAAVSAIAATMAAGGQRAKAATIPAPDQKLSLRRIMLSQGGVGYFEYDAAVDGAATQGAGTQGVTTLGLDVPRDAVSDVLASLVVLDAAGSVASVELPSADASGAALAGLPIPRAALDRPLDLLNALQGVSVTVAGPTPMTGRILHAEPPQPLTVGRDGADQPLGKTRVTLLTDAGLQQFVLEDVAAVQVADPALRARLLAALAALRGHAAAERRHLRIRVEGQGARTVHLGMVVGAPLWKASYRLMLPALGDAGKARLQGWAVLENDGLEDWDGVELTLQSGNPVAFRQAIYQTYYVDRPEAPVDVLSHALPPADAGVSAKAAPLMRAMEAAAAAPAPMAPPSAPAAAVEGGVRTSFTLRQPLSLAAGHSAAVPFIDRALSASRIDLLAPLAAHPLAAVRLVNDTGSLLPPGIVTTYDDGGFTGDARLGMLPAGEFRLLTYAEDAAVSALWQQGHATTVAGVAAAGGVLRVTRRQRATTTVSLRAPAGRAVHLLVEIPRERGAALSTNPAVPIEQTESDWRLDIMLAAGEQRQIVADADRLVSSSVVLGTEPGAVAAVLNEQGLPAAARAALGHLVDLQRAAAGRDADSARLHARRGAIDADEARLRANLAAVPATDPLHGQLLRALAADEASLADLAAAQDRADGAARAARQALADAVSSLTL